MGCNLVRSPFIFFSVINGIFNSKPNKIKQLKLVGLIIEKMMPIGTEEDPADIDEESPSRVGTEIYKSISFYLLYYSWLLRY